MHFEVPKAKKLKEFGGEYVMIVISILTALALEHAAQTLHHNHVAHQASERIEAEIDANIAEIADVIEHNRKEAAKLEEQGKFLLAGIRGKVDEAQLMKQASERSGGGLNLSVHSPTFAREAWEVAVANGAIAWMDAATQARYAAAYANMRDVQALGYSAGNRFFDGVFMQDVGSNLAMGTSNPREVFRLLNQMIAAYGSTNGNLINLKRELEKARGTRH